MRRKKNEEVVVDVWDSDLRDDSGGRGVDLAGEGGDVPDEAGNRGGDYYSLPGFDDVECLTVIQALNLNFALGSAMKYIWRAGRKTPDPRQDLVKAIDFLMIELNRLDD